MKKNLLLLGCGLLTASMAPAGTFELNNVKGLWPMDGSLASRWPSQQAMSTQGFTDPVFVTAGGSSWLALASVSTPGAGLRPSERLLAPNSVGANGFASATLTHTWSLIMDVRFPVLDNWTSIMQTDANNTSDAVIFLDPSRRLRFLGANGPDGDIASPPLTANTWYRLAITATAVNEGGTNKQVLRAYVNGVLTDQTKDGATKVLAQGRYALGTSLLLFSDNNDETAVVDIGSVAYWGQALAATDIGSRGGPLTGELTWPDIIPTDGYPPLTGALKFGNFTARFVPDLAAIAASAQAPTLEGAVEKVTLNLGTNGGIIPNHSSHTFGGEISGQVMPNGDIVVNEDSVTLNYAAPQGAPPADIFTRANVTYSRFRSQLTPQGAITSLTIYFPPGFGVALDPLSKQLYAQASLLVVPVDADLLPPLTLDINRENFGSGNDPGPIYPMVDRVPVRFKAMSTLLHGAITLTRETGDFAFNSAEDLVFHREPQIVAVLNQVGANLPGAVVPASNDFYFVSAKSVTSPVHIRARADGSTAIETLAMSLDPTKFGAPDLSFHTHYPRMNVTWNEASGSKLVFSNGAIDPNQSGLSGAYSTSMPYATGVPTKDCNNLMSDPPVPEDRVVFYPDNGVWRFSPDGGLRAKGLVENLDSDPMSLRWGQYTKGTGSYYVHEIKTPFEEARVMTAGVAVPDSQLTGLQDYEKPAALLLSGFGTPDNAARVERPGTDAYYNGLTDYPGVNLRCSPGSHDAVSRLADQPVPMLQGSTYPLSDIAKYCLRPGGVTARHVAAANAPDINFLAFGTPFELSRLSLGYLDGENVSSGVAGSLHTWPPADFSLSFKSLLFGAQGQLLAATLDDTLENKSKILGSAFWNLAFTPLALDFPQPAGCPQALPDVGFVRVTAKAKLSAFGDGDLTGTIGIFNGDIVAESDDVAKGLKSISRFTPGSQLQVTGPTSSSKPWLVHPVCGIALNKHYSTGTGTLTVAGLMDVPFFTDMPVVLSANSNNLDPIPPPVHVRQPWAGLDSGNFDADHRGTPAGTSLGDYRGAQGYDPHAQRGWQNGINFDLPVFLEATHVFRSRNPVSGNEVLLFSLTESVRSMTPDAAELTFDGGVKFDMGDLIPQISLGSLLADSGLLGLPVGEIQDGLDGVLGSVKGLDALLADHIQDLLKPGLDEVAAKTATQAFLDYLSHLPNRTNALHHLSSSLAADLQNASRANSTFTHTWTKECAARIHQAISGIEAAKLLVQNPANLQSLASAIGTVMSRNGHAVGTPTLPDTVQLEAIQALLDQIIVQLQVLESQLGSEGNLATALQNAFPDPTTLVDQALADMKAKWEAPNDAYGDGFLATATKEDLANDLSAALADRIAGSPFAGIFTQLLRQYAADPQMSARQAIDDTLRMAEQLVAASLPGPSVPGLGVLKDTMAAASLRGYARINGDSLHELRLDGKGKFTLGGLDEISVDTWFLMRDVDSSTPVGQCLGYSDIQTEVQVGASGRLQWGGIASPLPPKGMNATLAAKVSFDKAGNAAGFAGDLALSGGFSFGDVSLNQLNLGIGVGDPNNTCVYGRGSATTAAMGVTAGLFVGTTCDPGVIRNADPEIGTLLASMNLQQAPYRGAMIYAEGNMSLMPILGIPPSCLLDLRAIGGSGYFAFFGSGQAVAGLKMVRGIQGEVLCIADVTGSASAVLAASGNPGISGGSPTFDGIAGSAAATLSGEVGIGYFSYDFEKTIRLNVQGVPPSDIGSGIDYNNIHWSIDY